MNMVSPDNSSNFGLSASLRERLVKNPSILASKSYNLVGADKEVLNQVEPMMEIKVAFPDISACYKWVGDKFVETLGVGLLVKEDDSAQAAELKLEKMLIARQAMACALVDTLYRQPGSEFEVTYDSDNNELLTNVTSLGYVQDKVLTVVRSNQLTNLRMEVGNVISGILGSEE